MFTCTNTWVQALSNLDVLVQACNCSILKEVTGRSLTIFVYIESALPGALEILSEEREMGLRREGKLTYSRVFGAEKEMG